MRAGICFRWRGAVRNGDRRLPFRGESSGVITEAILNRAPVAPARVNPELPGQFERIIGKALEKDRNLRYQGAAEIRGDLQRLKRDTESGRSGFEFCGGFRGRRSCEHKSSFCCAIQRCGRRTCERKCPRIVGTNRGGTCCCRGSDYHCPHWRQRDPSGRFLPRRGSSCYFW